MSWETNFWEQKQFSAESGDKVQQAAKRNQHHSRSAQETFCDECFICVRECQTIRLERKDPWSTRQKSLSRYMLRLHQSWKIKWARWTTGKILPGRNKVRMRYIRGASAKLRVIMAQIVQLFFTTRVNFWKNPRTLQTGPALGQGRSWWLRTTAGSVFSWNRSKTTT